MIQIDMQMPERCGVCFAMHTDEIGLESWCGIDETARDIYTEEINTKRPDWCPLKEQEAVVRCKDCRWSEYQTRYNATTGVRKKGLYCRKEHTFHDDDWYCPKGKQKGGDGG